MLPVLPVLAPFTTTGGLTANRYLHTSNTGLGNGLVELRGNWSVWLSSRLCLSATLASQLVHHADCALLALWRSALNYNATFATAASFHSSAKVRLDVCLCSE